MEAKGQTAPVVATKAAAFASSDHGPGLTKLEYIATSIVTSLISKGHSAAEAAERSILAAKELLKQLEASK